MGNHFNNKIHRNKKFLARTLTFVINFIRKTGGQGGPGGPGGPGGLGGLCGPAGLGEPGGPCDIGGKICRGE